MPLHRQDKTTKVLADELAALAIFDGTDRKIVDALAASGRVVHLPPHWALMSKDTPADACYVLLSGDAEVRNGAETIAQLHPGALVGEAALVSQARRNATVISISEVRALRLGYEELTGLFSRYPALEQVFRGEWDRKLGTS